jgi:hypothetical protein
MQLTQADLNISGKSRIEIRDSPYYGEMELQGTISSNNLKFRETKIISQHPKPGHSWCIKSGTLTYNAISDSLTGPWYAIFCSPGEVKVHRISQTVKKKYF